MMNCAEGEGGGARVNPAAPLSGADGVPAGHRWPSVAVAVPDEALINKIEASMQSKAGRGGRAVTQTKRPAAHPRPESRPASAFAGHLNGASVGGDDGGDEDVGLLSHAAAAVAASWRHLSFARPFVCHLLAGIPPPRSSSAALLRVALWTRLCWVARSRGLGPLLRTPPACVRLRRRLPSSCESSSRTRRAVLPAVHTRGELMVRRAEKALSFLGKRQ